MGKSRSTKKPKIKHATLANSFLTVETLIEERRETRTEFTCHIPNYSKLKECIEYKKEVAKNNSKWMILLQKYPEKLYIFLNTSVSVNDIAFCLRKSDGAFEDGVRLENCDKGEYAAVFLQRRILDSKHKLLQNDDLVLKCVYTTRPVEYNMVLTTGLRELSYESIHNPNVYALCMDLRWLYLSSCFYDFTILMRKVKFKVHKLILSTRSNYFSELFKENPYCTSDNIDDFEINASPGILHEVLLYMYSGKLSIDNIESMIEVFGIACKLDINILIETCMDFFKANFSINNLVKILCAAVQFQIEELEDEVKHFLREAPMSVKDTEKWTELIEAVHEITGDVEI